MKKAMVYIYESAGDKNTGHVDITVEAEGKGRIYIPNRGVVVLEDLVNPWGLKHFEDVLQEILKGYREVTVFVTEKAAKEIENFAWKNRRIYVNQPRQKFKDFLDAPTVPLN